MTPKPIVNLCLLGNQDTSANWPLGRMWHIEKTPRAIFDLTSQQTAESEPDAWLFWDCALGSPDPETVIKVLSLPGDVWHSGLRLGLGGLPALINFVTPTWMLNRDPDPDIVATSWRLSLRACVIRNSVLQRLGTIDPGYKNLEGASLEMGHRYLMNGAILRNVPWLVSGKRSSDRVMLPFSDEWRFIYHRMGRKWAYWALLRALFTAYGRLREVLSAFRKINEVVSPPKPEPFRETLAANEWNPANSRVSILIPTLDRYEYLRRLLPQLWNQTIRPIEIIVVDQTHTSRRANFLAEEFKDLPLRIFYLERPGQCSARNTGLQMALGDYILFLDDDDEVPADLIQAHLRSIHGFHVPVSCGDADVAGVAPLPKQFHFIRCSDVFPTNNTLIHRSAIETSGLFDLAYDHGERADADLGMRMYLSGTTMILNLAIRVLHHHASKGGLRTFGARVITYGSSRKSLMQRQLPSPTEIYLWKRYFTPAQTRERLLLSALGTLSFHGNRFGKILKLVLGTAFLPHTVLRIRKNNRRANEMLQRFPQIPRLIAEQTSETV